MKCDCGESGRWLLQRDVFVSGSGTTFSCVRSVMGQVVGERKGKQSRCRRALAAGQVFLQSAHQTGGRLVCSGASLAITTGGRMRSIVTQRQRVFRLVWIVFVGLGARGGAES